MGKIKPKKYLKFLSNERKKFEKIKLKNMEKEKINQIKKLAGKCLTDKWELFNEHTGINEKCAFCYYTIQLEEKLYTKCRLCIIPPVLCGSEDKYSLMDIINSVTVKYGHKYIDEITYLDSYKLLISILRDLQTDGKISADNLGLFDIIEEKFSEEMDNGEI